MKTKILITGFKPFGSESVNPSEILAQALAEEVPGVNSLILPVEFGRGFEALKIHLQSHQYDFIIQIGQAAGREKICLERVALNWVQTDQADEAGRIPALGYIEPSSPLALMTKFPLDEVLKNLKAEGHAVSASLSAGGFVCNELYYRSLAEFKENMILFVHVPLIEEQVSIENPRPSVPLAQQKSCLKSLLSQCTAVGAMRKNSGIST